MRIYYLCLVFLILSCSSNTNEHYYLITSVTDSNHFLIPSATVTNYIKIIELKDSIICHVMNNKDQSNKIIIPLKNGRLQIKDSDLSSYNYRFLFQDKKVAFIETKKDLFRHDKIKEKNTIKNKTINYNGTFGADLQLVSFFNGTMKIVDDIIYEERVSTYNTPANIFTVKRIKKAVNISSSEFDKQTKR